MVNAPKAVWEGEIIIMGIRVRAFVLDDGRRIIDAESMAQFLDRLATPGASLPSEREAAELARFLRSDASPKIERAE
jgi:hypothetical protein